MAMVFPLRNLIYDKVKASEHITDKELLDTLRKDGVEISPKDLNKALMHLEILSLVTVRWVGKDRRRVEVAKRALEKPHAIW